MLPVRAKHTRVWEVDARGGAVERKETPAPTTSGQRHRAYRIGLMAVDRFLKEKGFRSNIGEGSTCVLSYEAKGNFIDVAIRRPDRIAFVTSRPDYEYKQQVIGRTVDGQDRYRVNARVTTAQDMLGCDYVVQVTVSSNSSGGTRSPILIPLPKELENPSKHIVINVLGLIASAFESVPGMREAFSDSALRKAESIPLDELVDDRSIPLLPD